MALSAVFLGRALTLWDGVGCGVSVPIGTDFVAFWSAARLVVTGQLSDVYNIASQVSVETSILSGGILPFFYPPTFLLLCVPFGLLPFYPALLCFILITGAAYIWA